MREELPEVSEAVTSWWNGRWFCASCQRVYHIIWAEDAIVVCPECAGPVSRACGDEV